MSSIINIVPWLVCRNIQGPIIHLTLLVNSFKRVFNEQFWRMNLPDASDSPNTSAWHLAISILWTSEAWRWFVLISETMTPIFDNPSQVATNSGRFSMNNPTTSPFLKPFCWNRLAIRFENSLTSRKLHSRPSYTRHAFCGCLAT